MDQFIREVDEEYRRERIAAIWRRFGGLIVGLAILLVAAVGGWRYWQHVERGRAEAASGRYQDAVQFARDGKSAEAEKDLRALGADGPDGYRVLARIRLAAEQATADAAAGAKAFDALAADATVPGSFQDLARLRAAMIRLGTPEAEAGQKALEGIAAPTNPFRHTAREMLGLAALKRGDYEGAGRWFDAIAADRATPSGLRGRLEIYSALVAGGPVQATQ